MIRLFLIINMSVGIAGLIGLYNPSILENTLILKIALTIFILYIAAQSWYFSHFTKFREVTVEEFEAILATRKEVPSETPEES